MIIYNYYDLDIFHSGPILRVSVIERYMHPVQLKNRAGENLTKLIQLPLYCRNTYFHQYSKVILYYLKHTKDVHIAG